MNILYSDDVFPSGQYKDQLVSNVMQLNPAYIKQQAKQSKQFCFSDEVIHQLSCQISKEYKPRR